MVEKCRSCNNTPPVKVTVSSSFGLTNLPSSLKAASELLPNAKDSEKKKRLLGILNDDVVRIERLITDYSNMLKGEALEAKLQLTRFDLIKLINKYMCMYVYIYISCSCR